MSMEPESADAAAGGEDDLEMPTFLISMYQPTGGEPPPPEVLDPIMKDIDAVVGEMKAAGVWVFNAALEDPAGATVARAGRDDVEVTDGPYIEAKEIIGGMMIIRTETREQALGWTRRMAAAVRLLPVEVRAFRDE